jgi:hypothetical protein
VLSISEFMPVLPKESQSEYKSGFGFGGITGLLSAIVPMGPERLILQLCGAPKMFAVDLKSAQVDEVVRPLGDTY